MKIITETRVIFNRDTEAEKIATFSLESPDWIRKDGHATTVFSKLHIQEETAARAETKENCCLACAHMVQKIVDGFPVPSCPYFGYLNGDPAKTVCTNYERRKACEQAEHE